ncbi:MAG: NmrA family NAD(P)-binding protein [Gammaproteobacteria bacterium]|nr:NmrA family NAD(P)-binding protein [Gammaproteobacteria bacterium]
MVHKQALKVLVYGGTGSQARPAVRHLLRRGHRPRVLTRNPDDAIDLESAGAELIAGDLSDPDSLRAASDGADAVAFLLPAFLDASADGETCGRNAIDAAREAGVSMFAWNVSGPLPAEDSGDPRPAIFRYLQDSRLPYILLEPTTYMENWLGPWTAASVCRDNTLSYPVLADRKIGWIACDDIGALLTAAIERPGLAGKRYNVSGVEAPTGPELATLFSKALAREIRYYAMTPEEMGGVLDEKFGPGSGDRIAEMYREEQQDPNPEPKYHDMTPVLRSLPVSMTSIHEWVTRYAEAFQPNGD